MRVELGRFYFNQTFSLVWSLLCWGWLVYLIPLKRLNGFHSLRWFEAERPHEMTIPSPQVVFPDASHSTATTFAILLNIPPSQPYSSPSMVPSSSHPPKLKALKCWICLLPPSLSSTFPPLEPQRTPWRRVKNGWKESVEALNLHGHFTQCLLNSDCTVPQTKSNRGLIWSSHPHFSCCVSLRTPCTSSSLGVCDKTLEI